jgi:hypothetical protein
MNLTLKNLSNDQVINLLGELSPAAELCKITQERMKNRDMTQEQIIERLLEVCSDYL